MLVKESKIKEEKDEEGKTEMEGNSAMRKNNRGDVTETSETNE